MAFENLTPAEQIRYCRTKLARIAELEAQVRSMPATAQAQGTLRDLSTARNEYTAALEKLENPSRWQRINRRVNEWAANDRAKEEVKKQAREEARRQYCSACDGVGLIRGDGQWFNKCHSCDGTGKNWA